MGGRNGTLFYKNIINFFFLQKFWDFLANIVSGLFFHTFKTFEQ